MGEILNRNQKPRRKNKGWIILLVILLAAALALGVAFWTLSQRQSTDGSSNSSGSLSQQEQQEPVTIAKNLPTAFIDRNTASPYIALGDMDGNVHYSKNPNKKCYPASLTKLMTAIVAVENAPADATFTIGNEIYMIDPQSSRAYLTVGSRFSLDQLLAAMLLPSGNDAAYATAVGVGRLIAGDQSMSNQAALDTFCKKMNETASRLGCQGTQFKNPDGIHESGHYTTASDMLKIAVFALKQEPIARTVGQRQVKTTLLTGQPVTWTSTNRLLQVDTIYTYDGAIGLKTGTTDQAGYCLAAAATRDGETSIAIVMGASVESGRWDDARGLLDISFQ